MAPPQLGGCAVPALPARLRLLLLLLLWPPLTPGTTCPTPTSVEHAEIRVKSYSVSSRERYVCNSGFKRKAGTSTLTECVLNKTTNVAHWTTPSLQCIRDPTLAHQKPVPPSTVVTPRVTPEPKSPSPPGKEFPTEPEALPPKPNTTVASETATVPGSRLTPSQPPSAGTTETGSHEFSQAPSDTAAKTLEPTTSTSPRIPGLSPHSSKMMTETGRSMKAERLSTPVPLSSKSLSVAISTPVVLGFVAFVVLLTWYLRQRQTSQLPGIEMETVEAMPMTAPPAAGDVYREVNNSRGPENLVPEALRLLKESQERQKILSP